MTTGEWKSRDWFKLIFIFGRIENKLPKMNKEKTLKNKIKDKESEEKLLGKTDLLTNILHSLHFSLLIMCAFQRLFLSINGSLWERRKLREKFQVQYINKLWSFLEVSFPIIERSPAWANFFLLNKCFERQRFVYCQWTDQAINNVCPFASKSQQQPADLWSRFGNKPLQINITFPGCKFGFWNTQWDQPTKISKFTSFHVCMCAYMIKKHRLCYPLTTSWENWSQNLFYKNSFIFNVDLPPADSVDTFVGGAGSRDRKEREDFLAFLLGLWTSEILCSLKLRT